MITDRHPPPSFFAVTPAISVLINPFINVNFQI